MDTPDPSLRQAIMEEIELSGLKLERKMRLLKLLDQAFRQQLGVLFLSDRELEQRDILHRSF